EHGRRRVRAKSVELLLREELRDWRADLALLVVDEIGEALRPPLLGDPFEPLEAGTCELLRDAEKTHSRRAREDAELGPARQLSRVLDLQAEAKIRFVGAVAGLGFIPGQPLERGLDLDAETVAPDALHRPLAELEEELLVGERHLDVELGQLLQPICAEVLVSKAARDL